MPFRDLDEFLVVPPIVLPIRGRRYAFPGRGGISLRTLLQLQRIVRQTRDAVVGDADPDTEMVSDADEAKITDELLGSAKQQMIDDGCTGAQLQAVVMTLIAYHMNGEDLAEAAWNSQGEAPAPSPKPARPRGSRDASTARKKPAAPRGNKSSGTGT